MGWLPEMHLNADGKQQARRLADRLTNAPLDAIYSSPLDRSMETAQELAGPRQLPILRSEAAGEVHMGEWTGLSFDQLETRSEWKRFNTVRSLSRIPGGELMLETQARIVSELEKLRGRHPGQSVAVISHGDVIKAAVAYFLGTPLDLFHRIEISPASVSVVGLSDNGPHVQRVNDTGLFEADVLWSRRPL
jgi:broad specificity phosphatase PhoE